jgi:uncharacterized protein YqeY
MSIQTEIKQKMAEAAKARDAVRLSVLRGLSAAFTNELVAKGKSTSDSLTEEESLAVIKRQAKQRKDSIEQFEKGGRKDLADNERAELAILESMLPAEMPREEIIKIAKAKKAELSVTDKSKIGILVGAVMKETKGRANGAVVKAVVEELLA